MFGGTKALKALGEGVLYLGGGGQKLHLISNLHEVLIYCRFKLKNIPQAFGTSFWSSRIVTHFEKKISP